MFYLAVIRSVGQGKIGRCTAWFLSGYLLQDPDEFLERGERKQVYSKTYFKISEIEKIAN
ncbi:MAG: hypothetical protein IPG07_21245 [Crocinitomicaceae bacterium]|nr:hypothetical protein [Crocinitomicaceae bacterium]